MFLSFVFRMYLLVCCYAEGHMAYELFFHAKTPLDINAVYAKTTPMSAEFTHLYAFFLTMMMAARIVPTVSYDNRAAWVSYALLNIAELVYFLHYYFTFFAESSPARVLQADQRHITIGIMGGNTLLAVVRATFMTGQKVKAKVE